MTKDKTKKKPKDGDINPKLPPTYPSEDDQNEIIKDDDDNQRIPVPPGELPPLPIYAPSNPPEKPPAYV